jgi:hypothetical protein
MLLRIREHGDGALVHGPRGRPSNRKLAARFEQKILKRLHQRYADFGPTLAAEHLAKEGLPVSRETLRKWMTKAALWRPRSQRVKTVHMARAQSQFRGAGDAGQLSVPLAGGTRSACHLIALIDDASSRVWASFTKHDTTEENLRTCRDGYGAMDVLRPITPIKTASFKRPARNRSREQLRVDLLRTQFGRALNELGIEWIAAHSPQEVAVAASTAGPDDRGPTAQLGGNRRGRGKAA